MKQERESPELQSEEIGPGVTSQCYPEGQHEVWPPWPAFKRASNKICRGEVGSECDRGSRVSRRGEMTKWPESGKCGPAVKQLGESIRTRYGLR